MHCQHSTARCIGASDKLRDGSMSTYCAIPSPFGTVPVVVDIESHALILGRQWFPPHIPLSKKSSPSRCLLGQAHHVRWGRDPLGLLSSSRIIANLVFIGPGLDTHFSVPRIGHRFFFLAEIDAHGHRRNLRIVWIVRFFDVLPYWLAPAFEEVVL